MTAEHANAREEREHGQSRLVCACGMGDEAGWAGRVRKGSAQLYASNSFRMCFFAQDVLLRAYDREERDARPAYLRQRAGALRVEASSSLISYPAASILIHRSLVVA